MRTSEWTRCPCLLIDFLQLAVQRRLDLFQSWCEGDPLQPVCARPSACAAIWVFAIMVPPVGYVLCRTYAIRQA